MSLDIGVGRFEPFDKTWVGSYPAIKDPASELAAGTSLCTLGYPFDTLSATYDEKENAFRFDPRGNLAMFPIEGIMTREILGTDQNGVAQRLFIERSSPGLKGQSGGPVLDRNGTVWGIQSRTSHLSLGFDPPVPGPNKHQKVHQFLNAGLAVHPEQIVALLDHTGVAYNLAA